MNAKGTLIAASKSSDPNGDDAVRLFITRAEGGAVAFYVRPFDYTAAHYGDAVEWEHMPGHDVFWTPAGFDPVKLHKTSFEIDPEAPADVGKGYY